MADFSHTDLEARELERGALYLIREVAEHEADGERHGLRESDDACGLALEQPVPSHAVLPEMECESRQPEAVDEAFQERWRARPPDGIDEHEMVRPTDVLLHLV